MKNILNRKELLSLVVLGVLLSGLVASVLLVQRVQDSRSLASDFGVKILLNPESVTLDPGGSHTLDVYLNTNGLLVSAAKLQVYSSNTEVIELTDMTSASGLPVELLKEVKPNIATLFLSVSCAEESCNFPSGTTKIAQVSFKSTGNPGNAKINLGDSQVSVSGSDTNMLGGFTETLVSVIEIAPSPTASPVASPTPTPVPTPTSGAKVIRLLPIDDTHVKEKYPSRNYGSDRYIISDGSPRVMAYLKYDLAGIESGNIEKAYLEIIPTKERSVKKVFKVVDDVSWSEKVLTWRNKPINGDTFAALDRRVNVGEVVTVDITQKAKDYVGGLFSFVIDDVSGGYTLETKSKEDVTGAVNLVIETN